MRQFALAILFFHLGNVAVGDSDFFNSSSVPAEMIAGQKPKAEPVPGTAPVAHAASGVTATDAKSAMPIAPVKKVDMPREVFMDWVDGDEVHAAEENGSGSADDRAPSGKRAAPETKNIDDLLERELKRSGSKNGSFEEDEHRFIEVN